LVVSTYSLCDWTGTSRGVYPVFIFRYLLEASADVHAQTQTGDTALTYACENGHTDVADLLLQYGADLVT